MTAIATIPLPKMSNPSTGTSTPSFGPPSISSHLSSVSNMANSLYRRFTDQSAPRSQSRSSRHSTRQPSTPPGSEMPNGFYTPPHRHASPFQPPPLTPLTLSDSDPNSRVLSKAIAEEIRLLVPGRLQLAETWDLVYSLEHDGVSLATLYHKCSSPKLARGSGFILVVQDAAGSVSSCSACPSCMSASTRTMLRQLQIFGAYLTDPPRPTPSFYGTGECFLWRASLSSLLSNLPPPPSADTEQMGRSTTITAAGAHLSPTVSRSSSEANPIDVRRQEYQQGDSIRFKAFPYSGINDYLIHCETDFLSVGGGDGKYGLWLDGVLERGVSSAGCLTFGNEALSEEGEKFEVVGVEIWAVGAG